MEREKALDTVQWSIMLVAPLQKDIRGVSHTQLLANEGTFSTHFLMYCTVC